MYGALWRLLPGPLWLRLLLSAVAAMTALVVCALVVFPAIDALLAPDQIISR